MESALQIRKLALCHTGKVLGNRLRVLGDLQMYACTLEVCAIVYRINCIDGYDTLDCCRTLSFELVLPTSIARTFCESEMLSPLRRVRIDQKVSSRSPCEVRLKFCWFVLHKGVCILDKMTCGQGNRHWPTMEWYPETLEVSARPDTQVPECQLIRGNFATRLL
jgi:hypothetical protein